MRNVLSASEIKPKEHKMIWRKAKVVGIGAALAAFVFGATAGFSEDRSACAGARHDRSSERQYAHDQNTKRVAHHRST